VRSLGPHAGEATAFPSPAQGIKRCHQGLGNRPIEGVPKPSGGVVLRHERLGGLLSHYY